MRNNDYSFVVELEPDPDGGVLATFPDVRGAIAHGGDEAEALSQARTALAVALFGYLKDDGRLPRAKKRLGQRIAPHATDIMKIAVVEAWIDSGMSKTDFARLLLVDEKEARRILDPDAATKADRLEQALAVLGRRVRIAVEAA
jgi:antitoxin HicB